MNLSEYVKTFPKSQHPAIRQWIEDKLGVSEVYVRSMCSGNKPVPAKFALHIEKIPCGIVLKNTTAPQFFFL